jgi:hypothetical protein
MKKEIYILVIIIFCNLLWGGREGFFYFKNNKAFADGAAAVETTIKITICGNNIKETGEQCDNSDLGGASCASLGFSGGTLSCTISCDFDTSACTTAGGNGGGGGGGGGSGSSGGGGNITPAPVTSVILSGRAYPLSKVNILKDGQLALSTIAGPDSNFTATIGNLSSGNYTFSVYGEDKNGLRSSPFTFQITITPGVTTNVGGIFIAPTIAVDKSEVKKGDNLVIFGQSASSSQVVISVNSAQEFFSNATSDANGVYLHNFDTSVLDLGQHSTKSKALQNNEISSFSDAVNFIVGTKNVLANTTSKLTKCDLNEDGQCNLIDFSIAAFWYKRTLSGDMIQKEKKYLNGDGKIDLVDFSIMAFYWTG